MKTTRRSFIKRAALATGAVTLLPRSWAQVDGANDDVRFAVIGFHSRGEDHIKELSKIKGARITALCDVDSDVLDKGVADLKAKGRDVEAYRDIRKLLESKNVDAITIATPNHWHALAAIWGIEAGKDVYVEKPVSHTVWEGSRIIAAKDRHNKIVQAGTQSRSSSGIREAVEWVRQGNIGKIVVSRGLCYKPRPSIGLTTGSLPIPSNIDYDLWSGPAPLIPPHRSKLHYDWHWFWNYGDGDIGNQGIHEMDVARWFLGEPALSPSILAVGGRLGYTDDAETPNTLIAFHDYPKAPLVMEVRGLPIKAHAKPMDKYKGVDIGVVIECEGGYVMVPDYKSATAFDKDGKQLAHFEGVSSHFENFIAAVRSRKESDLNAPIREGYISTALCHTSNIGYRIGARQPPEAIREQIKASPIASATFDRMAEHLAANNVDLESSQLTLGQHLQMDPSTASFIDQPAANALLTREYRAPFVVT
jgi:predicted dehydrogenase